MFVPFEHTRSTQHTIFKHTINMHSHSITTVMCVAVMIARTYQMICRDTRLIGHGTQGKVYKTKKKNEVVKVVSDQTSTPNTLYNMLPHHPNVISILSVNRRDGLIYMIDGGSNMLNVLSGNAPFKIDITDILNIAVGICRGIHHLHVNGIVHGDIKLQNILLDHHYQARICDVDGGVQMLLHKKVCDSSLLPRVFHYASPSLLNNDEKEVTIYQTDWYACAVVLYTLFVHTYKFAHKPLTEQSRPYRIVSYREPILENRLLLSPQHIYDQLRSCACPESMSQWITDALQERVTSPPPCVLCPSTTTGG